MKESMMKLKLMIALAMMGAGLAQADMVKTSLEYDRVGMVSNEGKRIADERVALRGSARFMPVEVRDGAYAPGENPRRTESGYQARKSEMARRLVWLMLSAR
jgi:hypothetical protein